MGLFSNLLGRKPVEVSTQVVGSARQHTVHLVIPLSAPAPGKAAPPDAAAIHQALYDGLERQHAGQASTPLVTPESIEIEMLGPNADRIASTAINVLRPMRLPRGSHLIKRYGGHATRENRVELH